jgi:sugar phosphate isomerase/epimerase
VPPRVRFGVNLNFAKYVYSRRRAIEIVRERLGLRHAETVADNDFGALFYERSPEAFRSFHYDLADHAKSVGVQLVGAFTVYREAGAIAHEHPEIRESAYVVGLSLLEQAACYGARYVGASLFTMDKDSAEDPERYQALYDAAIATWKRWMVDARRLGVPYLSIEMAAAFREGCSTIDDTRSTLDLLRDYHENNPDTTVPVALCYDTGHGISPSESQDDRNRDFRAWFRAFGDCLRNLHLKNTDPEFLETWHFDRSDGIIHVRDVFESLRDSVDVDEVFVHLEVPGKRGRDVGEERAIEAHRRSIEQIHAALESVGYRLDDESGAWEHAD